MALQSFLHQWSNENRISSSGSSRYEIDGEQVSSAEYAHRLAKENILIKAKNFLVFQGDVEAIAAQSSKDLSKLIEQISGSLQFKAEYERLKLEQETTADESSITFNKKRGFNAEIKQYKAQAHEADRFNQLLQDRDNAVLKHVLWKLYHLEKDAKRKTSEMTELGSQLEIQKREAARTQQVLEEAGEEYALQNREKQKLERRIKKREKVIADKNTGLLPVEEKITITNANLIRYQKRINEVQVDCDRQNEAVSKLQRDLNVVTKALEKFEAEAQQQAQMAGMDLSADDIAEYERLKSAYARQANVQQSDLENLQRQLKTEEDKLKGFESKYSQLRTQEARLAEELEELKSQVSQSQSQVDQDTQDLEAKRKELGELISERQSRSMKETNLQEKLKECVGALMQYNAHQRESQKERKLREDVATLKRLIPGVKGLVYDLCRPKQRKYETAIATVLGKDFNSVIVDSFQTAQDCINYLKEQRSGVATFIPIESVVYKPVNNSLRGISDQVRLAVDTVDYEPSLEAAIHYVCGSAIVCDDLNVAKYVRWTKGIDVKAVTLDGAVIHKAGLMTGGKVENKNAQQWADDKVQSLRKLKEKLTTELSELSRSKHGNKEELLQVDISGLQMKLSYENEKLSGLQHTLDGREPELSHVRSQIRALDPQIAHTKVRVCEMERKTNSLQTKVGRIEDEIFGEFCSRIGVANIREYERAQSGLLNELAQRRLGYATQTSRLKNQLQFETERLNDTKARIQNLENSKNRDSVLLGQLESERQALKDQIAQVEEEIQEIAARLEDKQTDSTELLNKVGTARDRVTQTQREVDATRKKITSVQEEVEKITSGRIKTLRNCKIEGIELPLRSGSLDELQLDEVYVGAVVGNDIAPTQQEEDVEMTGTEPNDVAAVLTSLVVDFAMLDREAKERSGEEMGEELEREIQTLSSSLERMVVNTRANERLEDAKQRLTQVDREFESIRQQARTAKEKFERVKQQRYELFDKAFKHISGCIDKIYKELTRTKSFPLGGTAYLGLEDEEEPYLDGVNYNAMPPMKRFCDMELLSGGEKTMAALALLFAIHSYHPSPFFVLDEVDAALDNANVNNIARYILQHAGPGFQFIVISLKNGLFENSHALVGIYRNQDENTSQALTLGLQDYDWVWLFFHFIFVLLLFLLLLLMPLLSWLLLFGFLFDRLPWRRWREETWWMVKVWQIMLQFAPYRVELLLVRWLFCVRG